MSFLLVTSYAPAETPAPVWGALASVVTRARTWMRHFSLWPSKTCGALTIFFAAEFVNRVNAVDVQGVLPARSRVGEDAHKKIVVVVSHRPRSCGHILAPVFRVH